MNKTFKARERFRKRAPGGGRPRKSAKEKLLDGNRGKRKLELAAQAAGERELNIPLADGRSIPDFAPQEAIIFYNAFVAKLRTWIQTTEADEPALVLLSVVWARAMSAMRGMKKGLTVDKHRNPADGVFRDAVDMFIKLGSRFGLTPSDRGRLILLGGTKRPEEEQPEKTAQAPAADSTLDGDWMPKNVQ
jgi:phage terminase small subunit